MEASVVLLTLDASTGEGTYSFVCPVCEQLVQKAADREVVALLRTAGVETAIAARDVETAIAAGDVAASRREHPSARPQESPPFTLDDLIDFHFLLDREDWFSRLMSSSG